MVFLKYFNEAVASSILLLPLVAGTQNGSNSLPTVDLGYEVYRAADFNQTAGYYNFSNIRYAAPPLGNLRFRQPEPPLTDRSVVNDGSTNRICPQGSANWGIVGTAFLLDYIATGKLPNISTSAINDVINSDTVTNVTRDPRESEDCLFLDVIVPQGVFENAGSGHRGAPVLVWIYGGGYTSGSKADYGSPAGLLKRSSDGAIYVSMNYRLGAFGFLSGPSLQEDGTANAGLYDQRLALQWVQDNIHLFGGDKDRVTIFGESAGGGSVIHQITAFGGGGGNGKVPFQQAIPQSAGWFPIGSPHEQERIFRDFLAGANASSLAVARNASSEALIAANARQVARSIYGQFTYSPAVDGDFVPLDPKTVLAQGRFAADVRVLAGHNADEGLLFAPPVTSDEDFVAFVRDAFPSAAPDVVEHITRTLYPPVGNGTTTLYANDIERAALLSSEAFFTCGDYALNRASENDSYRYLFAVPPGLHGQDVGYTYYDPAARSNESDDSILYRLFGPVNETLALVLQDYITSFAASGVPESAVDGLPEFGVYGRNASVVRLDKAGIEEVRDPAANERCRWWMLGLYY